MLDSKGRAALAELRSRHEPIKVDAVSHVVRQFSDGEPEEAVFISAHNARRWFKDAKLESPSGQARNLIIWLGTCLQVQPDPAAVHPVSDGALASIMGAKSDRNSISYIMTHLKNEGVLETGRHISAEHELRLTFKGWARFDELNRQQAGSRHAFMAMEFNLPKLDEVFAECFSPAVEDAGFDLLRLTDGQGAGLIDAQMRVWIRTAKFLIADLSTANRGAYWEAGFAEGLGRPVIYVCEDSVSNHKEPDKRPHFDTNHLNTVVWSHSDLSSARRKLADLIRDTFPTEASMSTASDGQGDEDAGEIASSH